MNVSINIRSLSGHLRRFATSPGLARLAQRARLRSRSLLLLGGALCLASVGFVRAASSDAVDAAVPAAAEQDRPAGRAEDHARRALDMLKKKRETSDPAYLQHALDALDDARAIEPDHLLVMVAGVMVDQDRHRFVQASAGARKIIAKRPDDPTGHLLLGDALLELGDYDGAVDAYQRALDLRPDLRSYNRAAHLRWLHGDVDGAIEALELAIDAASPRDPEATAWCYVDLGDIHRQRGDAKRALLAAQRAQSLVNDYFPAMVLEARARAMLGERDEAISLLERAIERLPHVVDLLFLSELLHQQGREDDARDRVRQAELLAESDPRPLSLYYARHRIDGSRALELAEAELSARKNIAAYDAHAMALVRVGESRAAERAIERAMALTTPDASLHLHHALIQLELGAADAALVSYRRALALNPHVDPMLAAELRTRLETK